jgi:hypothetical protein
MQREQPRHSFGSATEARAAAAFYRRADYSGCAFVAASAEAPPEGTIKNDTAEFRTWIRTLLIDLTSQARAADPVKLGRQPHVLCSGGGISARMDHDLGIAADTRVAVQALADAAIPSRTGVSRQ